MAKKLTKKELKEPDEFQTFSMKVLQYVTENRKRLYVLGAVFLAVVLAAGGYAYYQQSYEAKALELYTEAANAVSLSPGPVLEETLKSYEKLVTAYPRSAVAPLAHYHLGNLHYDRKEYTEAVEAYESFIARASGREKDRFLVSLAHYGMAYSFENLKEYSKALEAFQRAAETTVEPAFQAMMDRNMGRVSEAMGNVEKAREYYEKSLVNLKDPLMEQVIRVILSRLGEPASVRSVEKPS